MEKLTCCDCGKPKATLVCGICSQFVCKKCVQFVDEDMFSFYQKIPKFLEHKAFCGPCYSEKVESEIGRYLTLIEQSKNVSIFYKDQGKETRRMIRGPEIFNIKDCEDRDQAILRLAFFAAQAGYFTLVDVELKSKKVRDGSYQHLLWDAVGVPVID